MSQSTLPKTNADGVAVGVSVGVGVGAAVGTGVGAAVGTGVGAAVGTGVGVAVGDIYRNGRRCRSNHSRGTGVVSHLKLKTPSARGCRIRGNKRIAG